MPFAAGLYYHEFSSASPKALPLVLLHGAGGMHLFWPPEIRRLPGYWVYTLDLPGHGKSDQSGGMQTIASYTKKVLDWLEAVGLHSAVFIGHGILGGAVASSLALSHSEHVLGIGLISTAVRFRIDPAIVADAANPTTFYKAVQSLVTQSFCEASPKRLVELAAERMGEVRPSVLHGDLCAGLEFDCFEEIGSIHCPTLVVCGELDQFTPLRSSQFLADSIPGAELFIVPQAGHMVILEKPGAVSTALLSFLSRIPSLVGEI
jgi:pimeloyl-ACP methyl ester carboxylesterase